MLHEGHSHDLHKNDFPRVYPLAKLEDHGGTGSLTVSISGPGGGTKKVYLSANQRSSIGTLNVFGLAVPGLDYDSYPGQLELYIDSVSYTSDNWCVPEDPPEGSGDGGGGGGG